MVTRILRVLRFVSVVGSALVAAGQVRDMYTRRSHVWKILRRIVRQIG